MTESMAELRGVLSAKTLSRLGSREKAHAMCALLCASPQGKGSTAAPHFLFFCSLRCHLTLPVGRGFKCCLEFWLVTWDC